MRWTRLAVLPLAAILPGVMGGAQVEDPNRRGDSVAADRWEQVKLAVARHHASSHTIPFYQSLYWWADEREGRSQQGPYERLAIQGDALDDLSLDPGGVAHIRGSLSASLSLPNHSAVVIGGNLTREGRIEADGIVAIHVQGDVDGVLECHGAADVWIGGNLRGQLLTGQSTHLHVKGDLLGVVRPAAGQASLSIDVEGYASSTLLAAIDKYGYTSLSIAVGDSDLAVGLHSLWYSPHGFVAVTGALP